MSIRPPIHNKGHVLYITSAFPPSPGGSCVVNQSLLSAFDPESFTVVSHKSSIKRIGVNERIKVLRVLKSFPSIGRYNKLLLRLQRKIAILRIHSLVKSKNPVLIIGAYPNLFFLDLAIRTAEKYNLPFVAYLHDTIYEANIGTSAEKLAEALHQQVIKYAALIFVMSDGMKTLFNLKYHQKTIALRHTYSENAKPFSFKRKNKLRFFWGGAIYNINAYPLAQLSRVLKSSGHTLELTANTSNALIKNGFELNNCITTFYTSREDYLNAIEKSDVLVLALDKHERANIHFDEISTIFPTKTPEYLASGKPIVVICPKNYFLYEFFERHDCGFLIDVNKLSTIYIIERELEDISRVRQKVDNARKVLKRYFHLNDVRETFLEEIKKIES